MVGLSATFEVTGEAGWGGACGQGDGGDLYGPSYVVVTLPKAPVTEPMRFLAERIGPAIGSD